MRSLIPLIGLVLASALLASPAFAQALYKSTMPDGQVIYGDKPAPGAAKVEQTKIQASKGVTPPSAKEIQASKSAEAQRAHSEAAADRVRVAEKALADAEAELASGKEPLPGERIGTASGKSRLNDAYWERQKSLEAAVELARRNLENTKAGK